MLNVGVKRRVKLSNPIGGGGEGEKRSHNRGFLRKEKSSPNSQGPITLAKIPSRNFSGKKKKDDLQRVGKSRPSKMSGAAYD